MRGVAWKYWDNIRLFLLKEVRKEQLKWVYFLIVKEMSKNILKNGFLFFN